MLVNGAFKIQALPLSLFRWQANGSRVTTWGNMMGELSIPEVMYLGESSFISFILCVYLTSWGESLGQELWLIIHKFLTSHIIHLCAKYHTFLGNSVSVRLLFSGWARRPPGISSLLWVLEEWIKQYGAARVYRIVGLVLIWQTLNRRVLGWSERKSWPKETSQWK